MGSAVGPQSIAAFRLSSQLSGRTATVEPGIPYGCPPLASYEPMHAFLILAALLAASPSGFTALELRGGEVLISEMPPVRDGTRVIVRMNGRVLSLAAEEVVRSYPFRPPDTVASARERPDGGLREDRDAVSRRFAALSRPDSRQASAPSHAPPPQLIPAPVTDPGPRADAPPEREESYWRNRSRVANERVIQAREELKLLVDREQRLNDEMLALLSLGYDESAMGRHAWQLQTTRDSIDYATLEVRRAERALQDFQEEARREGIYPGWLRY